MQQERLQEEDVMQKLLNHLLLNQILILRYRVRDHRQCVRAVIGLERLLINVGLIHV